MQIAAWVPELSCRARRSDCRLQTANAVCRGPALAVFVREIRKENLQNTQGPGPSADPRLQMQIAACGGEGSCRAGDRVCRFQIANTDCSTRQRGALQRDRASLQIPDCKYRLQHTAERGAAETGMRCEKKTQNTDFVCRLQHFSLQMRSVRWHHSEPVVERAAREC